MCKRTRFNIHIVPPLGAYKSQLEGTYILWLLVYTVNVHCDSYICIYTHLFHRVGSVCFLHARYIPDHKLEWLFYTSVCLCVWISMAVWAFDPDGDCLYAIVGTVIAWLPPKKL